MWHVACIHWQATANSCVDCLFVSLVAISLKCPGVFGSEILLFPLFAKQNLARFPRLRGPTAEKACLLCLLTSVFPAVFHVNCRQWSGSRNSLTSRPWPRLCATRPWLVRLVRLVLGMLRCKWIKWQSQLLTVRAYLVLAQMNSFNETTSNDSLPGQFMKWADQKMTFLDPHAKSDMPRLVRKIST